MNETIKPTPGPWREGKTADSIISDSGDGVGGRDRSSFDYYGGYVIAESVAPCNKPLIMLAPDMREWLRKIALVNCTCDSWENAAEINPPVHDLYCMYRVMTGYQEAAEKEPN